MTATLKTLSIGFSGTRIGMSETQKAFFHAFMAQYDGFFHHGDCVGADAEAHDMVYDILPFVVHIHPPTNPSNRAYRQGHHIHPPKVYHERNKDIVGACDYLIAFPKSRSEYGGTWNTINYARKVGRPFTICLPNGDIGNSIHKAPPSMRHINLGRLN